MRNKSEVADLFIAFINCVKWQHSSTVKYVQSDGGGEYMCSSLQSFFKAEGIFHLIPAQVLLNKMTWLKGSTDMLLKPV